MDKSSTYPHFHISTATICRFVRTYITIFTNKIAQFQHMGEFTPQQLTKSPNFKHHYYNVLHIQFCSHKLILLVDSVYS